MAISKPFSSKFGNSGGFFFAKVLCFVFSANTKNNPKTIVFVAAM
jgi:hypothetical protein